MVDTSRSQAELLTIFADGQADGSIPVLFGAVIIQRGLLDLYGLGEQLPAVGAPP